MPRPMPGIQTYRDWHRRQVIADYEVMRRAYLYIARNETVDQRTRTAAMLKLNSFPKDSRPTGIVHRCKETGRPRGVLAKDFGLCRFRVKIGVAKGNLPGVEKASW